MQLIINALISFSLYELVTVSFSVLFITAHFFHFAHGVVITVGAYCTLLFSNKLGWPLYVAIPLSIACAALLGMLMEVVVYKPLRKRNATSLNLLLASLGMYIALQNVISLLFGDATQSIRTWPVREGIAIFSARITPVQIIIIIVSAAITVGLYFLLKLSKFGKAMRAVANDPQLARVSGIDSDRIILLSFALGSALAGVAGILIALDVDMTPTMGMNALMMGVVVVIIAGSGSIGGVVLGSLLLATAQHLATWYIGSQWQDSIAFIILILFLLFRPQGFFGKDLRKAKV